MNEIAEKMIDLVNFLEAKPTARKMRAKESVEM